MRLLDAALLVSLLQHASRDYGDLRSNVGYQQPLKDGR